MNLYIPFGLFVLAVSLLGANPRFRARVRVWLKMRTEKKAERAERTPSRVSLDAYHLAQLKLAVDGAELDAVHSLDARTWADLDLNAVFDAVDFTKSRVGQQYLRHLLRMPSRQKARIAGLNERVTELHTDPLTATSVRAALAGSDDARASYLPALMFGVLPERPTWWIMFPLLSLTALGCLVSIAFWPRALFGLLAVSAINICIQLYYRPRVEALIPAIHELPAFINSAKALGAVRGHWMEVERQALSAAVRELTVLRSATRWLKFEPGEDANPIVGSLYVYLNMMLLLDVNAFVFAINSAGRLRPTLQGMFNTIGYIDAVQSVEAWRSTLRNWCAPQFMNVAKELKAGGLVHPLVKNAIPNDFSINNSSALITGSNMSGKTTFLRALGVNAILAQSLATVVATEWCAPLLRVRSSIGHADSVLEGRSYYLAEVESVHQLILQKNGGEQHLFLVDELFRGTNTAERVAGGYAVLEYLNRGTDLVVVATHETELLTMLGAEYAPHHFREDISNGNLTFDFKLRHGHATTRNAIALLELMNFPPEVVSNARKALR